MDNNVKLIKDFPEIVTNEKVLREVSRVTTKEECEDIKIWDKLRNALSKTDNGVGLSAVQIGYPIRVALAILENKKKRYQLCLLNPEVLDKSEKTFKFKKEGCLSFPGEYTNRHKWIKVKDELNGTITYTGFESVVLQHEIDHMDGLTMHDRKVDDTFVRESPKVGRNDPCTCGSGKKFKKCCGK